jgi:hypothetical protein
MTTIESVSASVPKSGLSITSSPQLTTWLREQKLNIACTTYQSNRLFFVSGQANGRLKIHECLFDKPMGLYAQGEKLQRRRSS